MAQLKYYNSTTSQWEPVPAAALGVNSFVAKEVPAGTINGTNLVFTTATSYQPGTLAVFVNGLRQAVPHVTETNPGAGTFTLDTAPLTGDNVEVSYAITGLSSGNADTLDTYHASPTPAASTIPVLNSSGRLPEAARPLAHYMQKSLGSNQTIGTDSEVAFTSTDIVSGTKLTASGNGVVIGSGVSRVRVSYTIMADTASTAGYLYTRINVGATSRSQAIDNNTNAFKSTAESKMLNVTPGDVITIRADGSGGTFVLNTARLSFILVEVVE